MNKISFDTVRLRKLTFIVFMQKLAKGTIVVQKIEQQMLNKGKGARLMQTNQGINQEDQRKLECCLIIAFSSKFRGGLLILRNHIYLFYILIIKGNFSPF